MLALGRKKILLWVRRIAVVACAVCWPSGVLAEQPSLQAPRLEQYRLANGLRVVLAPDDLTHPVSVVVRYEVGKAHDPPGYRGLSHLLEHLTFRGSRHLKPLEGMGILERLGAGYNATTEPEQTEYYTQVTAAGLETILWLESERMGFALDGIDQAALAVEQRIVANEVRQRRASLGWLRAVQRLRGLYGAGHPFTPAEDEVSDVQAVELSGLQWFFQSTYRPDNATLVVVGDFQPLVARQLIEKYFGPVKAARIPRRVVSARAPKLCGTHRLTLRHRYLFGKSVSFTWPVPIARSAQARPRLEALRMVLQGRLTEALVRRSIDVADVDVDTTFYQTHALLTVQVDMHDQGDWNAVEQTVRREAKQLASVQVPQQVV